MRETEALAQVLESEVKNRENEKRFLTPYSSLFPYSGRIHVMRWIQDNWFKLGILLILGIGVVAFLSIYKTNSTRQTNPFTTTQATVQSESSPIATSPQSATQTPVKRRTANEVAAEFKILTQEWDKEGADLLTLVTNNSDVVCASILKNRTSEMHTYYLYMKAYKKFSVDYASDRTWVEYIDKSLNSMAGVLNYVRDACAAKQYYIASI